MNKQLISTLFIIGLICSLLFVVINGSRQRFISNPSDYQPEITTMQESTQSATTKPIDILYWGTTCPHCHDTIDWIEDNEIEDKIEILRKEVYDNLKNSQELTQKAISCGIDEHSIGVPLMFTSEGKCLIGTPDITSYLSQIVATLEATESAERSQP